MGLGKDDPGDRPSLRGRARAVAGETENCAEFRLAGHGGLAWAASQKGDHLDRLAKAHLVSENAAQSFVRYAIQQSTPSADKI